MARTKRSKGTAKTAKRGVTRTRSRSRGRRIGYAVVGLGHIAQTAVLPAFRNAKNARLVALVSNDDRKLKALADEYGVEKTYSYDEYDACLQDEEVDAVYIATPNTTHRDFVVRAAEAGVHVLCEKPMATSERDCEEMIRACRENDVRLMVAYRLHFEPVNLSGIELIREGKIGEPRLFNSTFSFQVNAPNIRLDFDMGGGPTWDIGIYCLNAARYLFGEEPTEVLAMAGNSDDARFEEVEESMSVILRFPEDRLATFVCSYNAAPTASLRVVGTEGDLLIDNVYEYEGERTLKVTRKGKTTEKTFRPGDQFGPELVYFSDCVLQGREPEPSGREGLADVRILQAILKSAKTGKVVRLAPLQKARRPDASQMILRPPVHATRTVEVEAPAQ